jgi:hypothetical protein
MITKPHRVSAWFLAVLSLIACVKAGPASQTGDSTTAHEKKPLRYRLIALEPSVCLDQSIDLEFELENTSNRKVLIDPRALLTSVMIFHEVGARVTRADLWGKIPGDQMVSLEPGKYYRKTTSYPLHDKFFSAAGVYSIQATYGQFGHVSPELPDLYRGYVESNTVLFELRECE